MINRSLSHKLVASATMLIAWGLMALAPQAHATAKNEIQAILKQYNGFAANFKQVAKSPKGAVISSSTGQLKVLRPNYFYLHQISPQELFVAVNNNKMELYDPFIEQVTRSPIKANAQAVPFLYLINSGKEAWAKINVEKSNGCYHITDPSTNAYSKVSICLAGKAISNVTIIEKNGNVNLYSLSNFNPKGVSKDMFKLSYPEGTEIKETK